MGLIATFAVVVTEPVHATADQELTRESFRASVCNITTMNISFKLDEAYGEPLVASKMRWTAGPNTNADCLSKGTYVWIRVRTETDSLRYLKLRPEVLASGLSFGASAIESPNWSLLFCDGPSDSATCDPEPISRQLFSSNLRFEGFEVVTKALVTSRLVSTVASGYSRPRIGTEDGLFSIDSMLADAIHNAIDPGAKKELEAEPEEPQLTPEQAAAQLAKQKEELANKAAKNVLSLMSTSLAQYISPAHECESERTIANWVQAPAMCQLNFGSESSHNYLCADTGKVEAIRSTRRARINLASDISEIVDIRQSTGGWASLVLLLNSDLQSTTDGNYKTNRWQITTNESSLDDLQQLAGSLMTLVNFCQSG